MKRYIYAAVITVLCLGLFYGCATPKNEVSSAAPNTQLQTAPAVAAPAEEKLTILTPLGRPPSIKLKSMAPRLDTLKGKTIYIVDNGYPGSDLLLKEMAAWFEREMPNTKALYKRKQGGAGGFEGVDEALWAEIKEKADAVIIGLGH